MCNNGLISVLYVDDDPQLLEIAKLFLERSGMLSVDTIASSSWVMEMMNTRHYDAIISDYEMPDLNGIELLKRIRRSDTGIPFILFTGRGREEVVIHALNNGADSYLQKGGNVLAQFAELENMVKKHVERRNAEIALEKSEKRYRLLVDHAQEGIFVIQDEMIVFYNPTFSALAENAGLHSHDLTTRPIFDLLHPNDRDIMRERFYWRVNHGEVREKYPFRIVDGNGSVHWFENEAVITEWNGNPATLNFLRDVTEQHNLEAIIHESENRYKELVNSLPKTILEMDEDLNLTFINKAGMVKFGYDGEDVRYPLSVMDLVVQSDREKIQNHKKGVICGDCIDSLEYTAKKKDGVTFPIKTYLSPVFRDSAFAGYRAVCVDITEEKIAKSALAQANIRLNLMTSVTRHDILNKISALLVLQDLSQELSCEPTVLEYLNKQQEITKIIQEHIEFTRYYQDIGVQAPQWQALKKIVRNAVKGNDLGTILVDCRVDGCELYADPLVNMVFFNLIENSLHHGGTVTKIGIGWEETREGLLLTYTDDGVGIPPDKKEQVFREGFGKHTGFGLFLTREILSITGIAISEKGIPGEGVRFEILVPHDTFRIPDLNRNDH